MALLAVAAVPPLAVFFLATVGPPSEQRTVRNDSTRREEVTYGYAIVPGAASGSEDRVRVEGHPSYDAKGDVLFVTVSVPRLTWLNRLLLGDADARTVELLTPKELLGDKTPQQDRRENLRLMSDSKRLAAFVALRTLGIDVPVRDGGVQITELVCEQPSADGTSCERRAPAAATLQVGDLITAVDDKPVNVVTDLPAALAGRAPGDVVQVTLRRGSTTGSDGTVVTVPVTLTRSGDRTILGIRPAPLPPNSVKFDLPFSVDVATGDVGGPSAGLAFTLAVLDRLSPGELTGGRTVAATGEIQPDGSVGEIGGIEQKTEAVLRSGASVFLVPASQAADARKIADGTSLEIVGVRTLDEALAALRARGGDPLPGR